MKNPVFISNKKEQIIYIYTIFDNSLLQLAKLDEFSTTILNIPKNSMISIKKCNVVADILVPNETIYEDVLSMNHLVL
tara:strand:- start:973 stop:1206 length:234 start_codon:yes stop_codon:yes gene_type:complete